DLHDRNELLTAQLLHVLGIIAYLQGDYPEARRLSQQNLKTFERLGDLSGKATSLHQLGNIAQKHGDYPQARQLYQQSLELVERLGDLSGKANSLGQLGILAYEQGEVQNALKYSVQAFLLFDMLHSPARVTAQRILTRIRHRMDEPSFIAYWREVAG